jgi:phosphoribosylanthranilate isomerase
MTRVKICGLTNREDAQVAIDSGADALGFVFERTSPRFIGEEFEWIAELPPLPLKVAVFGRVDRTVPRGIFDAVQGVEWDVLSTPSTKRLHAIRLRAGQTAEDISRMTVAASAILLDAYRADAFGGTGERVDWELAAEIVRLSSRPIILAGGLEPDNVAEAVRIVRPFAVDVSSGVESSKGRKDHAKVRDFIAAARSV